MPCGLGCYSMSPLQRKRTRRLQHSPPLLESRDPSHGLRRRDQHDRVARVRRLAGHARCSTPRSRRKFDIHARRGLRRSVGRTRLGVLGPSGCWCVLGFFAGDRRAAAAPVAQTLPASAISQAGFRGAPAGVLRAFRPGVPSAISRGSCERGAVLAGKPIVRAPRSRTSLVATDSSWSLVRVSGGATDRLQPEVDGRFAAEADILC